MGKTKNKMGRPSGWLSEADGLINLRCPKHVEDALRNPEFKRAVEELALSLKDKPR